MYTYTALYTIIVHTDVRIVCFRASGSLKKPLFPYIIVYYVIITMYIIIITYILVSYYVNMLHGLILLPPSLPINTHYIATYSCP